MIIDCHAHLEPRMLDRASLCRKMDAAGVARIALIPAMNDPLPATPRALLAVVRALCQRRATRGLCELVHRTTLTAEGDLRLGGVVHGIYARPDNDAVVALCRAEPERFWGWIFLNPRNNPAVRDELERYRSAPGMIGVKLHPHWHDYRTELLVPLLTRVEELRLPVLIHLGFGKRGDFRALCARFPRIPFLFAHAGFPFYADLWKHARSHPNLHVDLSSPYIDEPLVRAAVRALGPERCLYGTDAPYGFHESDGSYDYREIRGWVERLPIASAARERVLGGTFQAIVASSRARV